MATSILDLPMGENDADAKTVREYLKALLSAVWKDGESFSGKRPFGNSGWEYELYTALVLAGAAPGRMDDGELQECDADVCRTLIADAIKALH